MNLTIIRALWLWWVKIAFTLLLYTRVSRGNYMSPTWRWLYIVVKICGIFLFCHLIFVSKLLNLFLAKTELLKSFLFFRQRLQTATFRMSILCQLKLFLFVAFLSSVNPRYFGCGFILSFDVSFEVLIINHDLLFRHESLFFKRFILINLFINFSLIAKSFCPWFIFLFSV